MKKVLIMMMCVIMVVCMMPGLAWAEGGVTEGYEAVPDNRLSTVLVNGVTAQTANGLVDFSTSIPNDTTGWDQDSGSGSVDTYTYCGVYITMPKNAHSLKSTIDANNVSTLEPHNSDNAFLQGGAYQGWFPVANKVGDNYVLFNGGREYIVLLEWYDGNNCDGNIVKKEYVIVTRNLQNPAASVNGVQYSNLQDAINAATDGQTVTLLKDINSSAINIAAGKNIVLDLGGHKLSRTGGYVLDVYGTLKIANGSVEMTGADNGAAIWLNQTANVTVDSGAKIIAKDSIEPSFAVAFYSDCTAAGFTLKGGIEGENGLTINGNIASGDNNVSISDGATISVDGTGLYLAGNGKTVVGNANITGGNTGIEIRAGELTVNGGTIRGNGIPTKTTPNGNGTTTDGAGIAIAQHTTKLPIKVTVNEGNISGYSALYESNPQENSAEDIAKISIDVKGGNFSAISGGTLAVYSQNKTGFISGGTFSTDVSQYIPENYVEYAMRNGTYIVKASSADKPAFTTGNYWSDLVGKVYTEMYSAPYIPPTTPTDNVTNSGSTGADNATTSADLSGSTSTSNGTTTSTVDKTTADKIVDKAVANKSEEIVIDAIANSATAANSTTTAQVTIPTETLGAIAEKTEADVTIKTDVAEVKMDNAAAAAVSEQAEGDTVQIIAEKVKEDATEVHFELKVVCSDGKVISDFKGGNVAVTVALPKAMADKKVVCVYIDDNGHMSKVAGQKNADGTYTFNTGHFSSYAIMAEEEADAAIAAQKEAIKNIKIKLTSKQVKTKAGKKAVKITWTAAAGDKVLDGVEVFRSTERYKGYGTEPFYTSTKGGNTGSYTNTKSLKKGTKYYYRVRGYVLVDGQKVYTDYSTKAWRTVK